MEIQQWEDQKVETNILKGGRIIMDIICVIKKRLFHLVEPWRAMMKT